MNVIASLLRLDAPSCGDVLAAQPEAVAFEREDLGVVHEPIDHRGGHVVIAEDLAPDAEGLLLVTMSEARS